MGYRHIPNLYANTDILDFEECFALEKVHGTSTHVKYKQESGMLSFHSSGAKYETFVALFDQEALYKKFEALGHPEITVYGEGYGGKMQGMSGTYGKELRFIAFDICVSDVNTEGLPRSMWLPVLEADIMAQKLGLEFVPYERGLATLEWINEQRDRRSEVAIRRGCGVSVRDGITFVEEEFMREGVVLRPIKEYKDVWGNRILIKHKRDEFKETRTPREVDPEKIKILSEANAVATEWVVPMRMTHVLDKLPECTEMKHTGIVIKAMIEDVQREGAAEIVWSKDVEKAVGRAAARIYKHHISKIEE